MRIGIMTFPNSTSYGAVMQMYALYHAVENLGHQVEIINYQSMYMKREKHIHSQKKTSVFRKKLRLSARRIIHGRQYVCFRRFEKKVHLFPAKAICESNGLQTLSERYDAVICGSDQIWNPKITNSDMHYYLDFCSDYTKRISYAPSFGKVSYSHDMKNEIKQALQKFTSISIREKEGQIFLEGLLGTSPVLVLDPTFLLKKEEWELLERPCLLPGEAYYLYYTVYSSPELLDFCIRQAEKENKKVIVIGGNVVKKLRNKNKRITYVCDPSPEEWLNLIHHAHCVVTNSFHGMAFSIHYSKNFYVEYASDTKSRLEELIGITKLENRVVDYISPVSQADIDYSMVWKNLSETIERSVQFLETSIS